MNNTSTPAQNSARAAIEALRPQLSADRFAFQMSASPLLAGKGAGKLRHPITLKITTEQLAARFCHLLRATLCDIELRLINTRNATTRHSGRCASHDFCDASAIMLQAFESLVGYSPDERISEHDTVMSAAWTMARRVKFIL